MSIERHPELIEAAAKLMQQECIIEPLDALRRAAKRLGIKPVNLPKCDAVRTALSARLLLFDPHLSKRIADMRYAALEAMVFLTEFQPRAVGGVVAGNAPKGSPIQIECRAEHPDQVQKRLEELSIPAQQRQLLKPDWHKTWFEFKAGDFNFELHPLTLQERGCKANLSAGADKLRELIRVSG